MPASLPAEASQVRGGGGNQLLLLVTVPPIRHQSPTCPDIVSPGDNVENTRTSYLVERDFGHGHGDETVNIVSVSADMQAMIDNVKILVQWR